MSGTKTPLTECRVCFQVEDVKDDMYLVLWYSEYPFFAGHQQEASNDRLARSLPLHMLVRRKGMNCVAPSYSRRYFRYLSVYMSTNDAAGEEAYSISQRAGSLKEIIPKVDIAEQKVFGWQRSKKDKTSPAASVSISSVWVNCTNPAPTVNGEKDNAKVLEKAVAGFAERVRAMETKLENEHMLNPEH